MSIEKSKNKVYITLVICIGVVISIWLVSKDSSKQDIKFKTTDEVSVGSYRNLDKNDEWKNILVSINTKNEKVPNLLNSNTEIFDESTLTAQMSRDILSRYLIASKNGEEVTSESINKLVDETLSLSDYTQSNGIIYVFSNLNISYQSDPSTVKKYYEALNQMLNNRLLKKKIDPILVVETALRLENSKELDKLNPLILTASGIISDLLKMEVPNDAKKVHLTLLNSYSDLLYKLETMKLIMADPVKGLSGIALYGESVTNYKIAMLELGEYLENKIGPLNNSFQQLR